jgi:glutaminyl-peptide cyclotransferase
LNNFLSSLIIFGLLLVVACRNEKIKIPDFDEQNAMCLVKKLTSFGPRNSGTLANLQQAEFIAKTVENYGAITSCQKFKAMTPEGFLQFVNIEAVISGEREDFIIIGSHFDSKKLPAEIKFEGANDGASSTATLMELIRSIKKSGLQPEYTLRFVFFDGEECFNNYAVNDGLFGSKHYANKLKADNLISLCQAVIILDMVGDKDLKITLPIDSDRGLCKMLFTSAKRTANEKYFDYLETPLLDDHVPFQKMGIPVIDIIDFEFGPGNSFWHSSEDSIKNISAKSLKIVGQTTLDLILNGKFAKKP